MTNLTDDSRVRDLLERVAGPQGRDADLDLAADLARGRTALRQRRRRTLSTGLGVLSTVAVLGVGAAAVVTNQPEPSRDITAIEPPSVEPTREPTTEAPPPTAATTPPVEKVRLVARTMEAGSFTFGATPQGWEVQGNRPLGVTIARIGDPDQSPDSFLGKLVVMLDNNSIDLAQGKPAGVVDGREIYLADTGAGHLLASVRTLPGEPGRVVRLQFPTDAGWTQDAALRFLASVRVGADAQLSVG